MLFLLIAGSVYETVVSPTDGGGTYHERELNFHVASKKVPRITGPAPTLDGILSDLERRRLKDTRAAVMWAVYRDLSDRSPSRADVDLLLKSKEKGDRAFAEILTAKKLEPAKATALAKDLPEGTAAKYAKLRAQEKSGQAVSWSSYRSAADGLLIAGGITVMLVLLGCGLLLAFVIGRSQGKFKPLGLPALPMTQLASDAYAMKAFLMIVVLGLLPSIVPRLLQSMPGSSTIAAFATIGVVLWVARARIWGIRSDHWSLSNSVKGVKALGQGALIYLMGLPFIGLMMVLGPTVFRGLPSPEHPVTQALPQSNPFQLMAIFVSAAIQAPICEELAFRGSMLPAMTRLFRSPVAAVIVVNLVFAAIHPTGIPSWPALASIGVVASFAVYQTGSIWTAVWVHAIHNSLTLCLALATGQ